MGNACRVVETFAECVNKSGNPQGTISCSVSLYLQWLCEEEKLGEKAFSQRKQRELLALVSIVSLWSPGILAKI